MPEKQIEAIKQNETVTHTETKHEWPHIPKIQWEQVFGPISNTNIATFVFFVIVLIFSLIAKNALKSDKSRLKSAVLNLLWILDEYMSDSFGDKKFSRYFLPLIGWIFCIILFWNLFGLVIDWAWSSISPTILQYLRPFNSDLNTTLVLAIITVFTFLWISLKYSWVWNTLKWYLFNFHWETISEKIINVFVWWLHLLSVPSTLASLSMRLFWNIFAWVVLIWVITYLWHFMSANFFEIWRIISIPFWFFEIFVAFIQAAVFMGLMISYFKQSKTHH